MRFVSRDEVSPPEEWLAVAAAEREDASAYYSSSRIRPFEFRSKRLVLPALRQLFRNKCAYCESDTGVVASPVVSHFRPASRVVGRDGGMRVPGYWWLASEWRNQYLACAICDRNKGARFPVAGHQAHHPGEEADEVALLIDPCLDDPERLLVYRTDGLVAARPGPTSDRAEISIDVYGLNRQELVILRKHEAETLKTLVMAASASTGPIPVQRHAINALQDAIGNLDNRPYTAFQRQVLRDLLQESGNPLMRLLPPLHATASGVTEMANETEQKVAFDRLAKHDLRIKTSNIGDRNDTLVFSHSAFVSRVEIENFRNIEELSFAVPSGDAEHVGWKVLLGENGAGKSSVLQAIALALMGRSRVRRSRDIPTSRLLRNGSRPPIGAIRVNLSADTAPIELTIAPDGIEFPAAVSYPRTIVLAFGAARWMPRRGALRPETDPTIRVTNLFNPFIPVHHAPTWLLGLTESTFRNVEPAILRLLGRPDGDRLRRLGGRVVLHQEGRPRSSAIPIEDLSDGYQTMLAVAGEIAATASQHWDDLSAAEAVILLDEIGAHLHPRWKMNVVETLRSAFPRMQFIATTHDPLCLRGLTGDEILVLRRGDDGELVPLDGLGGTETLRVDQLLTSPLFGLGSTLDPETEREFNEYYALLAKIARDPNEEARLAELRRTVGGRGALGSSPRDQAIYEIVDEYLARHPISPDSLKIAVDDETKQRVGSMLAGTDKETA